MSKDSITLTLQCSNWKCPAREKVWKISVSDPEDKGFFDMPRPYCKVCTQQLETRKASE